jgi:hypothetical protein
VGSTLLHDAPVIESTGEGCDRMHAGFGQTGYVLVPRRDLIKVRTGNASEADKSANPLRRPQSDPLSYLAAVVRGEIKPTGLSSLEINMVVTEILDAARESARTGKRVYLK